MRTATLRAAALTILLALGTAATAQGVRPAYYYPSPGYYNTTAGLMYISTPGYSYNAPSGYAPRSTYAAVPSSGVARTYSPTTHVRRSSGHSDNPNAPAYYSGAIHSQHARGWDAGQHGK